MSIVIMLIEYVCIHTYVYIVGVYIYIYIYIYVHTHTYMCSTVIGVEITRLRLVDVV